MRTLIILGGTFDPPHIGHLLAAEAARQQFGEATVVFMPAGDPYRKSQDAGRAVSTVEARMGMLELALADNADFTIDAREANRSGATYTIDTLRELAAEGVTRPVIIFGADAILDMANWKEPDAITRMSRIALAPKLGVEVLRLPVGAEWLDMPLVSVSSTLIRANVREGRSIRYMTTPAVEAFIGEHGLYRGGR